MANVSRVIVLLAALTLAGCGDGDGPPQPPELEQWFRDTRGGLDSTYGRIKSDSIRADDNTIIFQTEDGSSFSQDYRPSSQEGYERVGDPQPFSDGNGRDYE